MQYYFHNRHTTVRVCIFVPFGKSKRCTRNNAYLMIIMRLFKEVFKHCNWGVERFGSWSRNWRQCETVKQKPMRALFRDVFENSFLTVKRKERPAKYKSRAGKALRFQWKAALLPHYLLWKIRGKLAWQNHSSPLLIAVLPRAISDFGDIWKMSKIVPRLPRIATLEATSVTLFCFNLC